jgi:hypothetical protein
MGWNDGPPTWAEMARVLNGELRPPDGSDAPAWSRKRAAYQPPPLAERPRSAVPYAELHAHSAFSFLDGASTPEELVAEAARLGLADHIGLLKELEALRGTMAFEDEPSSFEAVLRAEQEKES